MSTLPKIDMKKRIKVNGIIIACVILGITCFPRLFLRQSDNPYDYWAEAMGLALLLLGFLLRVSSRGYKSELSSGGNALVRGGPYAVVRNPMYLGIFLSGVGLVLLLFQWWALFAFLAFMLIRYATLISKEEKVLEKAFGKEYREYAHAVPRLLPRIAALKKMSIGEYLPLKLSWFPRELNSFIPLLVVIELVELWEAYQIGEYQEYLWQVALFLVIIGIFFIGVMVLSRHYEKNAKHS